MDMIYPSIGELTNDKVNRYALVIATAKCARAITDEYVRQRERAERLIENKATDKSLASMITKEFREEKAVRTAINRIKSGEYVILGDGETASADTQADAVTETEAEAEMEGSAE